MGYFASKFLPLFHHTHMSLCQFNYSTTSFILVSYFTVINYMLKVEDCNSALEFRSVVPHNRSLLINKNLYCSEIPFVPRSKFTKPKRNREIEK
jgi:hypothetical protein